MVIKDFSQDKKIQAPFHRVKREKIFANEVIIGISLDGVPQSGIVRQHLIIAEIFSRLGIKKFYLDLGFHLNGHVNPQMHNLDPYLFQSEFPPFVDLFVLGEVNKIPGYNQKVFSSFITQVFESRLSSSQKKRILKKYRWIPLEMGKRILKDFIRKQPKVIVITNLNHPRNPWFMEAFYKAAERYVSLIRKGALVLIIDFEIHNNCGIKEGSEKLLGGKKNYLKAYPSESFAFLPKPVICPRFRYLVPQELLAEELFEWSDKRIKKIYLLGSAFFFERINQYDNQAFRRKYNIPPTDYLLVVGTRLVPDKNPQAAVYLLFYMNQIAKQKGIKNNFKLVFTASTQEHPSTKRGLVALAKKLKIEKNLVFCNGLANEWRRAPQKGIFSVLDAYNAKNGERSAGVFFGLDDYEGYGLPPGEMFSQKAFPFLRKYRAYSQIWGRYGFKACLLDKKTIPTKAYTEKFFDFFVDDTKRKKIVEHNYRKGRKFFSFENFANQLMAIILK